MTEAIYRTLLRSFLDELSEGVTKALLDLKVPESSDYLYFVVYPERFYREMGIELRSVKIMEADRREIEVLLQSLLKGEGYHVPDALDPEDYHSPPEDRGRLLTGVVIEWLQTMAPVLQRPCFAAEPDSYHLYSFTSKRWQDMDFCH